MRRHIHVGTCRYFLDKGENKKIKTVVFRSLQVVPPFTHTKLSSKFAGRPSIPRYLQLSKAAWLPQVMRFPPLPFHLRLVLRLRARVARWQNLSLFTVCLILRMSCGMHVLKLSARQTFLNVFFFKKKKVVYFFKNNQIVSFVYLISLIDEPSAHARLLFSFLCCLLLRFAPLLSSPLPFACFSSSQS